MKHGIFCVLLAVLAFSCTATSLLAEDETHAAFDTLLKKYVHNGLVKYVPLRDKDLPQLNSYLKVMSALDIASLAKNDQLAAYINIYNATMIKAVCDRYVPGYSPSDGQFKVFEDKLVHLKTGTISLNDLENKVIRPTFKDPRIHVALVCGAISCPPILDAAYQGKTLDTVLDAKLKDWLTNDPTRNLINKDQRTMYLSKIFEWYADDFGGSGNIATFVNQHHPDNLKGYAIQYLDYDWKLNILKLGVKKQAGQ